MKTIIIAIVTVFAIINTVNAENLLKREVIKDWTEGKNIIEILDNHSEKILKELSGPEGGVSNIRFRRGKELNPAGYWIAVWISKQIIEQASTSQDARKRLEAVAREIEVVFRASQVRFNSVEAEYIRLMVEISRLMQTDIVKAIRLEAELEKIDEER